MVTELKPQRSPLVEINILPFKAKHFELLMGMLKNRQYMGISDIKMKNLPKTGYISMIGDNPVAAGFLRRVEGGYAQFDGLVSDPFFGSEIRHLAIELVVSNLIADAKRMKLQGIIAFTADKGVLKRAEETGFKLVDQSLLALRL